MSDTKTPGARPPLMPLDEALGREPQRPKAFEGIELLPKRVTVLPADVAQVKSYIAAHCE